MCGAGSPVLKRVAVEGSELSVCQNCARFGRELAPSAPSVLPSRNIAAALERRKRPQEKDILAEVEKSRHELVDDYGKRIRDARNRMGWSHEEMGKRLNERKSVVAQLEGQEIRPDDRLIKKLENLLGIRLREEVSDVAVARNRLKTAPTLGDVAVIKRVRG